MSGAAGLAAARRRRAGSVQQPAVPISIPPQKPKPQTKNPMTILYEHEQKINQLLSNNFENQLSNNSENQLSNNSELNELKEQMNTLEKLLLKLQTKLIEQEDEIEKLKKELKKDNLNEND